MDGPVVGADGFERRAGAAAAARAYTHLLYLPSMRAVTLDTVVISVVISVVMSD